MTVITLPWPSRDLSPNARLHWAKKSRAVKQGRSDGAWAALQAGIRTHDYAGASRLDVSYVFVPPDRRPRDDDNMISSIKSYRDGIADVIGINDSKWVTKGIRREEPRKPGEVRIEICAVALRSEVSPQNTAEGN